MVHLSSLANFACQSRALAANRISSSSNGTDWPASWTGQRRAANRSFGSSEFPVLKFLEILIIVDGGSREGRNKEINHCGTYSSPLILSNV